MQNRIVRHPFINWLRRQITHAKIVVTKLQGYSRSFSQYAGYEPDALPAFHFFELIFHQGGCNSSYKNLLPCCQLHGSVYTGGGSSPFKRKQGRYVNPVPFELIEFGGVSAFGENNIVISVLAAMILSEFHEAQWRILVFISGFK